MKLFDLRPPPDVLIALTHTDIKPIDALCELVDNAIDSFTDADGMPGGNEIDIDVPTSGELQKNIGVIRISDNGPGMTAESAEKALTAGYSGKSAYDKLGMFGMGLNIATGKFARKTRLITATKLSDKAIVVEVDLEQLVEQKHFKVQPWEEDKSNYFPDRDSGTIIELSGWWLPGSPNSDNPRKLIQNGPSKIRQMLGRRYATLLRSDSSPRFSILVKGEKCVPFEHCVWAEHRFVKRSGGNIPARQVFDKVLDTRIRCEECGQLADKNGRCPVDVSHKTCSVEERVRGWIGVQRYDDNIHFGIDLIRNGRAIRVLEKDAFFTFEMEDGTEIRDYPIDGTLGRIVGEVHLNHVRVDFTKQDFDRRTREWRNAMEFLRGKSSLQTMQPGSSENHSPVMKIFAGYRRVRKYGMGDMYMGERQPGDKKAKRIHRDVEKDFIRRFNNREEGYYDDAKWWEKVEEASRDTDDFTEQCPKCEFQNSVTAEICGNCGDLLKSKKCVHCERKIRQSAAECEHCGKLQVAEGPWLCQVCGDRNSPDSDECTRCGKAKGSINVFSPDNLIENSAIDEDLSVRGLEIDLPGSGENKSQKFDLEARSALLKSDDVHLPSVINTDMSVRKLQIFLDKSHPMFLSLQLRPEHAVAIEAAALIYMESLSLASGPQKCQYNILSLQAKLLDKYWKRNLSDDSENVQRDIHTLLDDMRVRMRQNMRDITEDIFNDMPPQEKNIMITNMQELGIDIAEIKGLKESGEFLLHIPPETVISAFRQHTGHFFDKAVWKLPWNISGLPDENVKLNQKQTRETYLNCLEDSVGFLRYNNPRLTVIRRAQLSVEFLRRDMID